MDNRRGCWPEQLDLPDANLPTGQEAPDQGVHVQADVPFTEPTDDPPEGEVIDIAEGPRGHAVPEVGAPAPQYRV